MTDIKSAINQIQTELIKDIDIPKSAKTELANQKALHFAIRSLQAWEEVLKELEAEKNKSYESWGVNYLGLKRAINIINQHLAEIEE